MKKNNIYLKISIWFIAVLFFAFQFILRLWPGITMEHIIQSLSIDATVFGILASAYYCGYAPMQIPAAILIERFGTRIILTTFSCIAGTSFIVFVYSTNIYLSILARFLIGAGSSAAFLSVSKITADYFDKTLYSRIIGLSFTFGLMGAIFGGSPTNKLIEEFGILNAALILGLISISIGILCFTIFPKNHIYTPTNITDNIQAIKYAIGSKDILYLCAANLLMVGALEGFADIWGINYLMYSYSIEKTEAANLVSRIFYGMIFGGPFLAYIASKIGNYPTLILSGVGLCILFSFILFVHGTAILYYVNFIIGIFCCYQVIMFVTLEEMVPKNYLNITIALLNSINMLGGSFFHTIIGKIMDLNWNGAIDANNVHIYEKTAYQYSLMIIPFCALIGTILIIILFLKNKSKV